MMTKTGDSKAQAAGWSDPAAGQCRGKIPSSDEKIISPFASWDNGVIGIFDFLSELGAALESGA